jgi:metal-responsive CopG/Arc/MetJ family transcriptional regulator
MAVQRRVKVSVTLDPELLRTVDRAVEDNPDLDRSKIFDAALRLWTGQMQDQAMEEQFAGPVSNEERLEREAWKQIQIASARRLFWPDAER